MGIALLPTIVQIERDLTKPHFRLNDTDYVHTRQCFSKHICKVG